MVNVAAAIFTSHLPMGLMIPEKYVTVLTCIHSPSILYQDHLCKIPLLKYMYHSLSLRILLDMPRLYCGCEMKF